MNFILSLLYTATFISLFISGVSRESAIVSITVALVAVLVGFIAVIKEKGSITAPKNFWGMALFSIIINIYLFFIRADTNPFVFPFTFTLGILFWLLFYNLKKSGQILQYLILTLVLLYSGFYAITKIFNIDLVKFAQLFFAEGLMSRHYHIGDLWALVLVFLLTKKLGKFDLKTWLLIDVGFLFLVLANARSAYLSLIAGFLYFLTRRLEHGEYKKLIPSIIIGLVTLLFIFSSVSKTTLFSRPYFAQSVESFFKYPLGVGLGNFKQISLEYYGQSGDASQFSLYTHNIFLEALSGVGVFSILFLYFIYTTTKEVITEQKRNLVWGAVYLAITANFMFDTTYTIPGLVWIWFMTLGVFQSKES